MKQRILTILILLMILSGLSLLLYPTVSNYILAMSYRRTITEYRTKVEALDTDTYDRLLDGARAYNQRLAKKGPHMHDPLGEELDEYYALLDPLGTGIMGYVVIPKINISLPVYHGISDSVLQNGIGHLPGTSLPVGGEGTHVIISGHRGLPSSRLFTDIDQLVVGDTFSLRILNEVLTYEVDQIITILPTQLGLQRLENDQDYCTLLTCTPYGINTHRLLVRGHRIPTPENADTSATLPLIQGANTGWLAGVEPIYLIAAICALLVAILLLLLLRHRRRKRRQEFQPGPDQWLEPEPQPWAEPEAQQWAEPEPQQWAEPEPQQWAEPESQPWAEPEPQPWAEPEPQPWAEPEAQQWTEPEAQQWTQPPSKPRQGSKRYRPKRLKRKDK